jgi:hypothetical protein
MAEAQEGLWMSAKERDRLKVLHEVRKRHITQKRRLSTKLCLRESCGSLEAGLEHGIELGKYRTDGPARSFPTALLQGGDS